MTMTMTNPFATQLETLDRKYGRTITIDDWRRVGEKSLHTPAELSDDDLTILGYFDGEAAIERARARKSKALAPTPSPPVQTSHKAATRPKKIREKYPTPEAYRKAFDAAFERLEHDRKTGDWTTIADDDVRLLMQKVSAWQHHELQQFVLSINEKNKERNARINALEARLAVVEKKPELKYAGVWRHDATYAEGTLATHTGGLWLAISSTPRTPGTPASGWQLIVKSGSAR